MPRLSRMFEIRHLALHPCGSFWARHRLPCSCIMSRKSKICNTFPRGFRYGIDGRRLMSAAPRTWTSPRRYMRRIDSEIAFPFHPHHHVQSPSRSSPRTGHKLYIKRVVIYIYCIHVRTYVCVCVMSAWVRVTFGMYMWCLSPKCAILITTDNSDGYRSL